MTKRTVSSMTVFLIIVLMTVAMNACGSSAPAASSEPADTEIEEHENEMESYEEAVSDAAEESEDTMNSGITEGDAARESEEADYRMSMHDVVPIQVLPYSDGVAWIQYGDEENPTTAAVDKDGFILFTIDKPIHYLSPFSSGYAFYISSEGEDIYETTVDTEGNELWTADYSANEHIIAGGDGVFVVEKHTTGFEADYMEIGTVDAFGNTLKEYTHKLNGVEYISRCSFYTTYSFPYEEYGYWTYGSLNNDSTYLTSIYMGDGVFLLRGESLDNKLIKHKILYNPEEGILYYNHLELNDQISNGRFRTKNTTYITSGPEIPVATLYDTSMNMLSSEPSYYWGRTAVETLDLKREERDYISSVEWYQDGLFYHKHCYWNDDNEIVLHIDGYSDRDMQGGPFYDGKAVLWVEGADSKKYMTVIDESGRFLFDPVCIKDSYFEIWEGLLLVKIEKEGWCIFDTDGNNLHCISKDINNSEYTTPKYGVFSEGFVTITYDNNEHFKIYRMLYSIRDALEGAAAASD